MILKTGDVFASYCSGTLINRMIRPIERLWSTDNDADYAHAGIIINPLESFECLTIIRRQAFYQAYKDKDIIIARYTGPENKMTMQTSIARLRAKYEGKIYPYWRLPLFLFPPFAKRNFIGFPVCSEMVAEHLYNIGARDSYKGVNPDTLVDEWEHWKNYEIVFKGKL